MFYYQDYVFRYVTADTRCFAKNEFFIPAFSAEKGYYIDVLAINAVTKECFLCEVSYAKKLRALRQRLDRITKDLPAIREFLANKCGITPDWTVRPWLFIRETEAANLLKIIPLNPKPKITFLEHTLPWLYHEWDMTKEPNKPYPSIPEEFQ